MVDAGARAAVVDAGTSLLPVGVLDVEGSFEAGDCVELAGPDGSGVRGRHLRLPAAASCARLAGAKGMDEAVHRDNLVLL